MTPLESIFEADFSYIIKQTQYNKLQKKLPPLTFLDTDTDQRKDDRIARLFNPMMLMAKLTCSSPVSVIKRDGIYIYEHRYRSVNFILSVIGGLFLGMMLTIWTLNAVFEIDYPVKIFQVVDQRHNWIDENFLNGSSLLSTLNNLIKVSLPLGGWMLITLQCTNVKSFCKFINSWPEFFKEFEKAFSSYHTMDFNLTKVRNIYFLFWFSPLILILLAVRPANILNLDNPVFIGVIFGYWNSISIFYCRVVSYVKDFIILQTLKTGFREIRSGIKAQYNKSNSISREQVQEWMDLITFVRQQSSHAENYLSFPNLWSIFEAFISLLLVLSMLVFLFMNGKLGKEVGTNFLPYAIISTGFFTLSVHWKASIAEQLTATEESIVDEIIKMETPEKHCAARLEMKLICDLIYNDPTTIRVGNLLLLNKQLLLAFLGQLASYLVVILQFTKT